MNPYAQRLAKAQERYEQALRRSRAYSDNAMPGTYVTGNSGVSASRRRRLDRQMDKMIDLAKKSNWHRRNVARLQAQYNIWERNKDKPLPAPKPEKKRRPPTAGEQQRRAIHGFWSDLWGLGEVVIGDHTLRLLVGWCEEIDAPLGVVEIRWPDDAISWARAKSIQGVHFEETALVIVGALLEKDKETEDA